MILTAGNRRFEVDPRAMHRASRAGAVLRVTLPKTDRLALEFASKARAL